MKAFIKIALVSIVTLFFVVEVSAESPFCCSHQSKDPKTGVNHIHAFRPVACNCACESKYRKNLVCIMCGHRNVKPDGKVRLARVHTPKTLRVID